MINEAFFRMIAGIITLALVNANIIDQHQTQTITDILTIIFTGGGLLLFGIYEIVHLLKKGNNSDSQSPLSSVIAWFKAKAFVVDPITPEEKAE